ncbi:MAG: heat-inducible transcriptional repressor HrcA [Chloroflexota bacterium]
MLTERQATILKSIVRQYIANAVPVSSQGILSNCGLKISSATIRNEMAYLEEGGYITRPHHAAGSLPTDTGYRYYVGTLMDVELPVAEQRLINHIFYQAENKLDEWLSLATALTAQMVRTVAVVIAPKPVACQFRHLELIAMQDSLTLIVLVLDGAKVRQQLISFGQGVTREKLTAISNQLSESYANLNSAQISAKRAGLTGDEGMVTDGIIRLMEAEDTGEHEEPYIDGLHFILKEPEFRRGYQLLTLVELAEHRKLVKSILPQKLTLRGVQVVIGKENRDEAIWDYSVVISHYGIPEKVVGTIGVVGPTRMSYVRAISTVDYLSTVLSRLVAELYGSQID